MESFAVAHERKFRHSRINDAYLLLLRLQNGLDLCAIKHRIVMNITSWMKIFLTHSTPVTQTKQKASRTVFLKHIICFYLTDEAGLVGFVEGVA